MSNFCADSCRGLENIGGLLSRSNGKCLVLLHQGYDEVKLFLDILPLLRTAVIVGQSDVHNLKSWFCVKLPVIIVVLISIVCAVGRLTKMIKKS